MPGDEDKKSDKSDKKEEENKSEKPGSASGKDDNKLSAEQEKLVKGLVDRMSKFSTNVENADQKIIDNAHNRAEERKKLLGEIDKMKEELEPYLEKDEEKLGEKVKIEVDNALLIIMDKKYKAEEEVKELKKLLRERNQKIYELEQENKALKNKNQDLEDTLHGVPKKRTTQDNINMAMQSQDGQFDRVQEEIPVYDQPQSQDDEDDFWQEGKGANKGGYGGGDDLWIMGNKDNLPQSNLNAYNQPGMPSQPPGFKSIPKRPQGYNGGNDDMAFYGVGAKKV
ncbi:unnamed protein product [Moneuplotes crassus]|uniref:Uncharacterized protein n=1 Tax=Euplotes crassus TaxID=5936 RepID=A0AAD2D2Z1_EUPCR|nr:unnamed protein product [Moneuplotes crassus]